MRFNRVFFVLLTFISLSIQAKVYPPSHLTKTKKQEQLKSYYQYWIRQYLKPSNGTTPGGGYYVEMFGPNNVGSEGHVTTSEAMGYGMLITVMAYSFDPQAQKYFDGLFNMFDKHRSTQSRYLMSWVIHRTEKSQHRSASATDGDFDIAYSLLLADQVWGSSGKVNYRRQAELLINDLLRKNINRTNSKIMLGDWWNSSWSEISRPSDWMGGHLRAFYHFTKKTEFLKVRNKLYSISQSFQKNHSPITGLLPDFISGRTNKPASPHTLEGPYDGDYYYNAARVPMRFIIDYAETEDPVIKAILENMVQFFYQTSKQNAQNLKGGYRLNGAVIGNYFDAAFAAPIIAAATVDSKYQNFVNRGWDLIRSKKTNYYSDSISLLCLYSMSEQWLSYKTTATRNLSTSKLTH